MDTITLPDRERDLAATHAAKQAVNAVRRITNNHPALEADSPHRRDFLRCVKRLVEANDETKLELMFSITKKGVVRGHQNGVTHHVTLRFVNGVFQDATSKTGE